MKKILLYILPLLLLTACDDDNWFSHRVPYNDVEEPQQMVITAFLREGYLPSVYVNHSWFFLDPDRANKRQGWYGEDLYHVTKADYLEDAEVSIVVNDTATYQLHYQKSEHVYIHDTYQIKAGDKIQVIAIHPKYGTATATDVVPYPVKISVDNLADDGYNATFDLHLNPYHYTEGDVLSITAATHLRSEYYTQERELLGYRDTILFHAGRPYESSYPVYSEWRDTCHINENEWRYYLYGNHIDFAHYEWNQSMAKGFFGADCQYNPMGLCLPASAIKEELTIPMAVYIQDLPVENHGGNNYHGGYYDDYYDDYLASMGRTKRDSMVYKLLDITLHVKVLSAQEYLCRAANNQFADYYYVPMYPQSGSSAISDADDIINEIQSMFDAMGNMEGYQVYDNVDGGIGHITASANNWLKIEKE